MISFSLKNLLEVISLWKSHRRYFHSFIITRTPQTPIPMTKAIQIFRGILKGVHYLHSKGIIHGDLKISNVMIENSWEELPADIDINSLTESNDLSASRTSTPPNGDVFTPSESPWSPKPSPIPAGDAQDGKRVTFVDQCPSKRFDGV